MNATFIAVIAAAVATPTGQQQVASSGPMPLPTIAAPAPTGSAPRAKPTRYCVEHAPTGTRIPRRDCRTRDEWLALDFDPLDAKRR